MKAIVFLALLAFSQAAHEFYYAGTTNSTSGGVSPTANYAIIDSNGACTASSVATGYQKFTINATVAFGPTFYYITAMFQDPTVDFAQVQIYNGAYAPATPCGNITFVASASGSAPHAAALVYLQPGLYDVVVTTTTPSSAGVFAVHADRALYNSATNEATSPFMLTISPSSVCDTYTSFSTAYGYYQWAQTVTGNYDIFIWTNNATDADYTVASALFNHTQPWPLLGTGNRTVPFDMCAAGAPFFIDSSSTSTSNSNIKVSQNFYEADVYMNVPLTAGVNYTLFVNNWNAGESFIWGVWVRPTTTGFMGTTANFLRPSLASSVMDGDNCTEGSSNYNWRAIVFTAQYSTYVVDNGNSAFDTAACLYSGVNAGTPDQATAPVGCNANWLQCIDTGDIGPLHQLGTSPGANYTIVQTSFSSGAGSGARYNLYIYTGLQLGPLPSMTTGVMTSSASAVVAAASLIAAVALF